jgi:RNA polymerase sigma-70 factor (ECF subfamily)
MPHQDQLDEDALERLYRRLERPVYNVVYRWVWDASEAQEVVQEAFLRLWKMRARVRMETVEPLVYRIALNQASKRRRRRKVLRWVGLEVEPADEEGRAPLGELLSEERDQAVRAAVDALPEKYRAVVMLCEFSGMSYGEVAEALDIKVGTVGSRRHEALRRLREALDDWKEDA